MNWFIKLSKRVVTSFLTVGMVLLMALAASAAQKELTILTWMGQKEAEPFNQILQEFGNKTGIKVNHIMTTSGKFDEKLQTMVLGGVAPDVFFQTAPVMARYIASGYVAPIDTYIAKEKFDLRDFFPVSIDQYRWGGKLWSVPYDFGSRITVYNVDAFNEAGLKEPNKNWSANDWTFDQLPSIAKKLTRSDGNNVTRTGFSFTVSQRGIAPFLYSYGAHWVKSTPEAYVTGLTDSAAIAAFDFIQQVLSDGWGRTGTHTQVASGNVAISQFYPNAVVEMRETAKNEWDIAPWFRGPGGRFTDGGGTGWFLSSQSKYPEDAAKLLFYLASKEVQLQQLRSGQKGMARRSVAMHPDFMGTNPPKSMGVFIDAWMNILYEPSVSTFDDYWKVVKSAYDKLAARQISAQQMSAEVLRLGNPILKQAGKPVD